MIWYIIALVLSMLFASAAENLKGKKDLDVDGGTFHFRSTYNYMMVLAFLPFFLVAALRWEVGTDWPIYRDFFHMINEGTDSFSEGLFNLMNKLVFRTVGDFQGLVVLVAFLSYFFLFKAIKEQSISWPLSILIFFISCSFFASLNQLRQAITMPIMLYAYKHIQGKKPGRYLFWCLVAALIHVSSLVYIPLYLLRNFRPSLRRYVTIFGICLVTLPVLHLLAEALIRFSKYAWYFSSVFNSGSTENNFYLVGFVFQLVMLAIFCYYRFLSVEADAQYDLMLNFYLLSVLALLFTPVLTQVLRVSQCFGYGQILLVPRVINSEKNPTRRLVLYFLIVGLYTGKLLYDTYHLGWNGVVPYQTIFG